MKVAITTSIALAVGCAQTQTSAPLADPSAIDESGHVAQTCTLEREGRINRIHL